MNAEASPRWTTPNQVKAVLRGKWERGALLRMTPDTPSPFPIRIPIRGPTSQEISADFLAVRDWAASWRRQEEIPCEWRKTTHRLFGSSERPAAAVFLEVEAVIALLGVRAEWEKFQTVVSHTRSTIPELLPWLAQHPMEAIRLAPDWERLLAIVRWVRDNPRSGRFIREINLPGIHTKFVEEHRSMLGELLGQIIQPENIATNALGVAGFNRRYGFLDKPERIRIRFLDSSCAIEPARLGLDLTLAAAAFAKLNPSVRRVFITENEINFLTFPDHPNSLLIFGSGYGWNAMVGAEWLAQCEVYYWGDIDTHGFAILDELRNHLPHTRSLLMDQDTFQTLREYRVVEPEPSNRRLYRLTREEYALYDLLRAKPDGYPPRLEQERVPMTMLQAVVCKFT